MEEATLETGRWWVDDINMVFRQQYVSVWNGLSWLRIRVQWRALVNAIIDFRVKKTGTKFD